MPTLLRMPAIAAGADSAILAEWIVQKGVEFRKSETIATVETDKALVDMEAEDAGVILHFLVNSGEQVEVGAPIALSGSPGECVDDIDAVLRELGVSAPTGTNDSPQTPAGTTQSEAAASSAQIVPARTPPQSAKPTTGGRVFATPLVRRLARDADLDLGAIAGTGPNGRIVRRDIETLLTRTPAPDSHATSADAAAEVPVGASPPGVADSGETGYEDIPHTRIRAAIARRLTDSKQNAPHFYLRGKCRVDKLLALRSDLNAHADKTGGIKVSVNDLVVKAAARAHTLVPAMNVVWTEHATRQFAAVDIAVAVASERGLVTPVVRDAAGRSVTAVSADLSDLAERARLGNLSQREIEGGSFCISNLGMYGTEEFSAIINPPQSAILAVGAALTEPVARDGELSIATVMRVTLSVDHRPIDGSTAAEWMRTFVGVVENPLQILV